MYRKIGVLFIFFLLAAFPARAESPDHFINPPENINPDPAYVPGDYVLPDMTEALRSYELQSDALLAEDVLKDMGKVFIAEPGGELRMTVMKNETTPVLGYFRDYNGYISFQDDEFAAAQLLISVNSWDTGIPGRDGRIRAIFFEAMDPKNAIAQLVITRIVSGGPVKLKELKNGGKHDIRASGMLTFGGATVSVLPHLTIQWKDKRWQIAQAEPLEIFISALDLESNVAPLMKECNHQSVGNRVSIEWEISFA